MEKIQKNWFDTKLLTGLLECHIGDPPLLFVTGRLDGHLTATLAKPALVSEYAVGPMHKPSSLPSWQLYSWVHCTSIGLKRTEAGWHLLTEPLGYLVPLLQCMLSGRATITGPAKCLLPRRLCPPSFNCSLKNPGTLARPSATRSASEDHSRYHLF